MGFNFYNTFNPVKGIFKKKIEMNKETIAELQTIMSEDFDTEVNTEQTELLAKNYTDYFNILREVAEREL